MFICKGALPEQRASRVTPIEYDALSGKRGKDEQAAVTRGG